MKRLTFFAALSIGINVSSSSLSQSAAPDGNLIGRPLAAPMILPLRERAKLEISGSLIA